MDKLPREARDFLALTADAHDPPDPGARTRMQARLAALSLLPMPNGALPPLQVRAELASPAHASGWLASPKMVVAGIVALTLGGGLWALSARTTEPVPTASAAVVRAPSSAQLSELPTRASTGPGQVRISQLAPQEVQVAAAREVEAAPVPAREVSAASARGEAAARGVSSLANETALLRRATDKLGQHDISAALALLEEHRRNYRMSQLAQERNGLFVLANCLGQRPAAKRQAEAFVARAPSSLLVPRLVSACDL